jgi:Ser/Thr protein kinase RdoA (MazF antagonist)
MHAALRLTRASATAARRAAAIVRDFEPALCEAALPEALARFQHEVPAPLRTYLPGLPAAAAGPLLARLASGPRTLLHGDARLCNVFAPRALLSGEGEGEGAGGARAVQFVDFGDVAAGRGAFDIACLLASGMLPEDRCAPRRARPRSASTLPRAAVP